MLLFVCVSVSSSDTEVIDPITWSDYVTLCSSASEKRCDKGVQKQQSVMLRAVNETMTYLQQHDSWCFSVPSDDRLFIHGPHGSWMLELDMLSELACLLVFSMQISLCKDLNFITCCFLQKKIDWYCRDDKIFLLRGGSLSLGSSQLCIIEVSTLAFS